MLHNKHKKITIAAAVPWSVREQSNPIYTMSLIDHTIRLIFGSGAGCTTLAMMHPKIAELMRGAFEVDVYLNAFAKDLPPGTMESTDGMNKAIAAAAHLDAIHENDSMPSDRVVFIRIAGVGGEIEDAAVLTVV